MKRLGWTLAALAVFALPVMGGHPRTLGKRDTDRGYEWIAASRVLNADGSLKGRIPGEWLREGLEWQVQRSRIRHGLDEGGVPSSNEFCAPKQPFAPFFLPETDGRFSATLLLSEVAVAATLEESVSGFDTVGNPVVLFALSDVAPLHGYTPIPEYALIPFDRLVVHNRVFCLTKDLTPSWREAPPKVGDRVVLIGSWSRDAVVRLTGWRGQAVALAQVDEDEKLRWAFAANDAPSDMAGLRGRIDEAVFGGLFDLTVGFVSKEYGAPERREFGEMWSAFHKNGCRVRKAEQLDGGWKFHTDCTNGTSEK